ncbi:sulfite exporter TauE/SafE family protein [Marinomonas sp. IMCC 4694]|uniref:sulfite exporter TauE/SafE family protein n=1 Tax=Marinomonas sp. IMCC 4694 TaxID=2605432 RepID=UPI0011E7DCA1|nr:sulfite exporter TauE/SafE family protein [Marinomonas sp. IMCC 4694]TYL47848.1 sulfite exporter TauE/SafE family protein [Marinomonas sp. IMCC 4694]
MMLNIDILLLLLLVGAATGSTIALIRVSPTFIAIPALYLFFPVFGYSFEDHVLPIVATCITAFIPIQLYIWINAMKANAVDSTSLIHFAPGIAMGGVIGAQLLSIISVLVFKVAFSVVVLFALFALLFPIKADSKNNNTQKRFIDLPLGLLVGIVSLLSGNNGQDLSYMLSRLKKVSVGLIDGTTAGFVVFSSIAAMIGFIFPAKPFNDLGLSGFAGAIHLPSLGVLALAHTVFYWLCRHRGNALDKKVLAVSVMIFLACSVVRIWW